MPRYRLGIFCFAFLILLVLNASGETLSATTAIDLLSTGNSFLDKGQYEQAIGEYQKVIQNNPTYRPAYRKLGDTYRFMTNYDLAIDAYMKFVGLSEDKNDMEGKSLLLDVAKAWEETIGNSTAALSALEGLLNYYYPESNESVDDIIKQYRETYLQAAQTTKFYNPPAIESTWKDAMELRGKILRKLNRKKEAYEHFSRYATFLRYKYLNEFRWSPNFTPSLTGDIPELYFENQEKPTPEDWPGKPWIIVLSPENPEYVSQPKDIRHWEDSIQYDLRASKIWHYIFQAKPGYRFSKLIVSADMTADQNKESEFWAYNFDRMIPPHSGVLGVPFQSYQGTAWSEATIIQKRGIRVFAFSISGLKVDPLDSPWKVKAEFQPESYYTAVETTVSKFRRPTLTVLVEPRGKSHSVIDDNIETIDDLGATTDYPFKTGWHTIFSEKTGFPKKETKFYWDSTTSIVLHITFGTEWSQATSDLVYPANVKNMQLMWDNTGTYRIIVTASPLGQDDLYLSSSKNLTQWSPLERMSINDWSDDNQPYLFQDTRNGRYILIWRSKRSAEPPPNGYDDLWESTSSDFKNWTRPNKILTVPQLDQYARPMTPLVYQEPSGQFQLFVSSIHSHSEDGINWSKPESLEFEYRPRAGAHYFYFHLPNGKLTGSFNEGADWVRLFDTKDLKNFKTFSLMTVLMGSFNIDRGCQLLELGGGEYGFIYFKYFDYYLSRSFDLVHWSKPLKILDSVKPKPFSNFIKAGDFIVLIYGNEIWYTTHLIGIPGSSEPVDTGGISYKHHGS